MFSNGYVWVLWLYQFFALFLSCLCNLCGFEAVCCMCSNGHVWLLRKSWKSNWKSGNLKFFLSLSLTLCNLWGLTAVYCMYSNGYVWLLRKSRKRNGNLGFWIFLNGVLSDWLVGCCNNLAAEKMQGKGEKGKVYTFSLTFFGYLLNFWIVLWKISTSKTCLGLFIGTMLCLSICQVIC